MNELTPFHKSERRFGPFEEVKTYRSPSLFGESIVMIGEGRLRLQDSYALSDPEEHRRLFKEFLKIKTTNDAIEWCTHKNGFPGYIPKETLVVPESKFHPSETTKTKRVQAKLEFERNKAHMLEQTKTTPPKIHTWREKIDLAEIKKRQKDYDEAIRLLEEAATSASTELGTDSDVITQIWIKIGRCYEASEREANDMTPTLGDKQYIEEETNNILLSAACLQQLITLHRAYRRAIEDYKYDKLESLIEHVPTNEVIVGVRFKGLTAIPKSDGRQLCHEELQWQPIDPQLWRGKKKELFPEIARTVLAKAANIMLDGVVPNIEWFRTANGAIAPVHGHLVRCPWHAIALVFAKTLVGIRGPCPYPKCSNPIRRYGDKSCGENTCKSWVQRH